jgi:lipopolysaccharide heptosyltransferase I
VKVLIVRLSAIGDVVHTLPALSALKRAGHEVSWLVEPAAREVLAGHPLLETTIVAPAARRFRLAAARATLRDLRRRRFDVALDLQGLFKSASWARLSGARRVIGHARRTRREPLSALLLHETAPVPPEAVHVIDKNLALLRALDVDAVGTRDFVLPPAPAPVAVGDEPFALLNPGGGWAGKLWPAESFGALARRVCEHGLRPIVTWGPGEQPLAERVVAASNGAAEIAPATSLLGFVELARRARVVVAADTGPLHLACAVGAPVVALFGPTDPARNGPFAPGDAVVRRVPACAPCYRRGCAVHAAIMNDIAVEEVARAVQERLARAENR